MSQQMTHRPNENEPQDERIFTFQTIALPENAEMDMVLIQPVPRSILDILQNECNLWMMISEDAR